MTALPDPLDEALGLYKEIGHELVQVAADLIDPFDAIVAAARRVAEAPEVWWCEEHNAPSVWLDGSEPAFSRSPFCFAFDLTGHDVPDQNPCRMVRKLLIDPGDNE